MRFLLESELKVNLSPKDLRLFVCMNLYISAAVIPIAIGRPNTGWKLTIF
jgi:hypothetical protein